MENWKIAIKRTPRSALKTWAGQVLEVADGEDLREIQGRLDEVKVETQKPSLVIIHTIIEFGSKKQGTSKVHGSP